MGYINCGCRNWNQPCGLCRGRGNWGPGWNPGYGPCCRPNWGPCCRPSWGPCCRPGFGPGCCPCFGRLPIRF